MLDMGIVEKSGNFIGTVLHLPSNTLVKRSSRTADHALFVCFRELEKQLAELHWFCITVSDGLITDIMINGLFEFSCSDFTIVEFEDYLDSKNILLDSLHQFNYQQIRHVGYVCNRKNYERFLENILSHDKLG